MPLKPITSVEFEALLVIDTLPDAAPVAVGLKVAVNVVFAPAFTVCGVLRPLMVNPVPETDPFDMVTATLPLLVSVISCAPLLPTNTLPKATGEGLAANWPCTPVPVSGIATGEPGALLVIERVPDALPAACGVNVAVNVALCPGLIVAGSVKPLAENPAPDADAAEIVNVAVPVLLNVTACEPVVPTATFPKPTVGGLTLNCGCGVAPVPLSAITRDGSEAVLVTVTLPLAVPVVVGAKVTVSDADCPPASVAGVETPLTLNTVPVTAICEIEMFEVPVFFSVTVWL